MFLRLSFVGLDLLYSTISAYGLYTYQLRKEEIFTQFPECTLLTTVFPLLTSLGIVTLLRMLVSIFLFLIVPTWSVRDHRRLFMLLGGGIYANAKFPMLKYRDYVL